MNKVLKILVIAGISSLIMACSLGNILPLPGNSTSIPPTASDPEISAEVTLAPPPLSTPTSGVAVEAQPSANLDPCSLVTSAEAEVFFAEPAGAPKAEYGACMFNNAKDSLYAVTVMAAQDQQTSGILQGQVMLLGFTGTPLDEPLMTKFKTLAAGLDYKGFFTELVAASQGSTMFKARLVDNSGSDLVYWTWITVQNRRQGAFVAVRGSTLVNINLVVADTQNEEDMLAASTSLANKIFDNLPAKFTLAVPTAQGQSPSGASPTAVVESVVTPPEATIAPPVGLPAPGLISPADQTAFTNYPRTTTLQWAPVEGANRYVVEIQACQRDGSGCFTLPKYQNPLPETNATTFTFDFIGDQPGQWRVWAVDGSGNAGLQSGWWKFTYAH